MSHKFTLPLAIALSAWLMYSPAQANGNPCPPLQPCQIEGADAGSYQMAFPRDWDGRSPLKPFVFFHGHNGTGAGVARNQGLAGKLGAKGYVLIAPDGPLFNFGGRSARGWAARPEGTEPRGGRDDIAFVEAVLDDAAQRVRLDMASLTLSGFSSGGSMAWYFGCYSNRPVAAIIAVAGGLRRPLPTRAGGFAKCPGGPRKILHIHGFSDRQVPLEGRAIRAWHQGDVFEGLAVQRQTNGCRSRPDRILAEGALWCRSWNQCKSGKSISLCLHPGGHTAPKGWLTRALNWASKR